MSGTSFRPRNLSLGVTVAGVVLLLAGVFISNSGNSTAMTPACIASAVTVLLGMLAVGRTVFQRRQKQEEHDAAEYHRQHAGTAELFGDADEAVRLATRTNRQYMKYFIPVATIVIGVILGAVALNCWFKWRGMVTTEPAVNPLPMAILSFCGCIATLVAGSFFIGVSRESGCRWLRPASAWLFLSGFLFLLGSLVFFCEHFHKFAENADLVMAKIGIVIIGILAVEMILAFVIEFYRPRMPNEEERPLPESRLLSLFTEPGSVARNVADSLDYQFGFRVSDAWFYRFLERTIVPLFMVMVGLFWLMTCVVVVDPSETALRERFGKAISQEPMQAGVYFKLPYPFESIYRFSSTRVQELTIEGHGHNKDEVAKPGEDDDGHGHGHGHGETTKDSHENERIEKKAVLWKVDKGHASEADFLVGAADVEKMGIDIRYDGSHAGVGLISAHIPLFFKVKNLYHYTYNNKDTHLILKNLAQRELLEYFIQSDWNSLLGSGRGKAAEVLKARIQASADELDLGIEVVFVALTGLHPPVGVGESFERITQATVDRQKAVQDARTDAMRIATFTDTQVRLILNKAAEYRDSKVSKAEAESGRFSGQLLCYKAAPGQYMLNSYYDILLQQGASARKYVIAGEARDEVLWLNLERKERSGLLDLDLTNP